VKYPGVVKVSPTMRKRTIKSGLNLILTGVVSITLATFYHPHIAGILMLSAGGETYFILLGLLLGGITCCLGILLTFAGMLLNAGNGPDVRLCYPLILLTSALIIFFFLFFMSMSNNEPPGLAPGETINI
jgi:hypothetical protein